MEKELYIEKLERDMELKEKEFKSLLNIEKQNNENIKKNNDYLINEKNKIYQNLENKYEELNKELKSFYNSKKNNDEFNKIKNENIQLKVNLGIKEKELNKINTKLKEFTEKKTKGSNNQEINLNTLKNEDIPKLKEIFLIINKTVTEYEDRINQLEQNKDMVFHDKFIEFSKSTSKKICKNWNEELSQFKEDHYQTMANNYRKEISELKKENTKLVSELESSYAEINEKNIQIAKLNEVIKGDKEIYKIKDEQIKSAQTRYETVQKELEIYKVRLNDKENVINNTQLELALFKSNARMLEDEIDTIMELLNSMNRRDKKSYNLTINRSRNEFKDILNALCKNYNIFK